ncbi:MAG: hypothetical protein AAF913_09015, partial [Pseudomonadota bacterium]
MTRTLPMIAVLAAAGFAFFAANRVGLLEGLATGLGIAANMWLTVLFYGFLLAAISGLVGTSFGLSNIFHEDRAMRALYKGQGWYWNSPTLFGALAAGTFATYVVAALAIADPDGPEILGPEGDVIAGAAGPALPVAQVWDTAWPVVISAALLALAAYLAPPPPPRAEPGPEAHQRAAVGLLLGLALGWLALQIAGAIVGLGFVREIAEWLPGVEPDYIALAIAFLLVSVPPQLFVLMPSVGLTILLLWLSLGVTLFGELEGLARAAALGLLLLWLLSAAVFFNRGAGGIPRLKFEYPGLTAPNGKSHYEEGNALHLKEVLPDTVFAGEETSARDGTRRLYGPAAAPERHAKAAIDPLDALKAWHSRATAGQGAPAKPRLVLVATSGGAYRAGFWTALVLDKLTRDPDLAELAPNTRLLTGASGGMVGAAYFAEGFRRRDDGSVAQPEATLVERIEADILDAQRIESPNAVKGHETHYPIPRDSLSPVVRQLLTRDIRTLFLPFVESRDRGTVLEDLWLTLDTTFEALSEGEAEGWRPSLMFSPMLVETGQPLLIGNLDMARAIDPSGEGDTAEFFAWFPQAKCDFKVKTALRMNAAFPFVSPSTALPTVPYLRVVDAGYYDNYGVNAATAYLSQRDIRTWVAENCAGVALIEIRAFPAARLGAADPSAFSRSFQWFSTPFAGLLAARGSTMAFRNRQGVERQRRWYEDATGNS